MRQQLWCEKIRGFVSAVFLVVAAVVSCEYDGRQPWQNQSPRPPSISGPDIAFVGFPARFDVTVYDPDGHSVVVYVAWGDGDTSDYGDFVRSGSTVVFEHTWHRNGTFLVCGRCYDTYDPMQPLFSDWSHPLTVVVENPVPASENVAKAAGVRLSDSVQDSAGSD